MRIHKEGYKILTVSLLTLLLLNVVFYHFAGRSLFYYTFLIGSILLALISINFFRVPKRIFKTEEEGILVAPADGTIVVIEKVFEGDYLHEERIQISIFMSLFNAHVNWIPTNGKIIHSSHQNGRYLAAYLPKSSHENERSTIVIEWENKKKILLRQIAGAMAKRIVTYAKEGNNCQINEELGFIKFGSRVDIFLPLDTQICVNMDQRVYGNKTVLAKLQK